MSKIPEFVLRGWVASALIIVAVGLAGMLAVNLWSSSNRVAEAEQRQRASEARSTQLQQQLAGQTAEQDATRQERDAVAQERDAIAQERDAIAQERDAIAQERDAATAALQTQLDAAMEHIAALRAERDAARTNRSDLQASLSSLTAERDAALATEAELRARIAELTAEQVAAREELERVQAALAEIQQTLDGARSSVESSHGVVQPPDNLGSTPATATTVAAEASHNDAAELRQQFEAVTTERDWLSSRWLGAQAAFSAQYASQLQAQARAEALAVTLSTQAQLSERLVAERDAAVAERDVAVAERDAAVAERDVAVAERDAAVAERDAAVAERDVAVAERDAAVAERDAAVAERDAAVAERDVAVAERDAAVAERDVAVAERDAAVAERDAALAQLDEELAAAEVARADLVAQLSESKVELETNQRALRQRGAELLLHQQQLVGAEQREASLQERYRETRSLLAVQLADNQDYSAVIETLERQLAQESAAMEMLRQQLSKDQVVSQAEQDELVSVTAAGTTIIKLPGHILFESGSARIDDNGRQTLSRLADALASFPRHTISIEGHSDSLPIATAYQYLYPTNWELSAARASAAVQVLSELGIETRRMQAVGRADTQPVANESDEASRRLNRRIEILLYPDSLEQSVATLSAMPEPQSGD
jgi:chemotaxis protein MotB